MKVTVKVKGRVVRRTNGWHVIVYFGLETRRYSVGEVWEPWGMEGMAYSQQISEPPVFGLDIHQALAEKD